MKTIIYTIVFLFLSTTVQALDLSQLTTPGAERDALQQTYENQLKAGTIDANALSELGIIYHMQASETGLQPEIIQKAHDTLTRAYENDKTNPITMVYLGSVTTMMATTTDKNMEKLKFVKKGTRLMDRAVKKNPNDVTIRMIRGGNSLGLPPFLQRARFAVEDFSHVLGLIGESPTPFKAQVHFSLGQAYEITEQMEQAKAQWQQVVQLVPNTALATRAQEKL